MKPKQLFLRSGEDVHGNPFKHRLLYLPQGEQWQAWVRSESIDADAKKSIEDWSVATTPDNLLGILTDNLYLYLSREEVADVVLPALEKCNAPLAAAIMLRLARGDVSFPDD